MNSRGSFPSGKTWLAFGILAGAILVAYANSFGGPLVLDDLPTVLSNPSLRELDRIGTVLWPSDVPTSGRPLLNLSFALNYAGRGAAVAPYHATNLLIHFTTACLVFLLLRRTVQFSGLGGGSLQEATKAALAIALLWSVHPVTTASVTYISQRAESLMTLCYVTTLYAAARPIAAPGERRWPILAVLACAAGMAVKEVMVTAPVATLLFDRTFGAGSFREAWRRRRGLYVGLAATWLLLTALMFAANIHLRGVATGAHYTPWTYARLEGESVIRYLGLVIWPNPLVFDYGPVPGVLPEVGLTACAVVLLFLLGWAAKAFWRRRPAGFALLWFFGLLAPTSTLIPVEHQPMAENRLYLPLLPVVALGVLALHRIRGRAFGLLVGLVVMALATLTYRRNSDYATTVGLWADTVAKSPQNARAWQHYGGSLLAAGRRPEAIAAWERAARLRPDDAENQINLGIALLGVAQRYDEAIAHFREAVRLQPRLAAAHLQLGAALLIGNPNEEGLRELQLALDIAPRSPLVLTHIGQILMRTSGHAAEAMDHFRRALEVEPTYAPAHAALGLALASMPGRDKEAEEHYRAALRFAPDLAIAHNNLGALLAARDGGSPEAVSQFAAAVRLDPNYAEAHLNLGQALALSPGRTKEAMDHFRAGVRLNPDSARGQLGLARLLLQSGGSRAEARACLEAAARLEPSWAEPRELLQDARLFQSRPER